MRRSFNWLARVIGAFLCIASSVAFSTAPAATLHVGSDVSGAPFEYFAAGSKVPLGFDIDLAHALAAKVGSPVTISNHQFDDLLAAVARGQFDAAISAISDTSAREQIVSFIDYFIAGGGIIVPQGNPLRIFGIDALCGYAVTTEAGTSYEGDLKKQSADCVAVGLGPIRILSYATDDDAFAAFIAAKAPAYVADYPVGVYRSRNANEGKALEVVGRQFDVVPYGIAVSKRNAALLGALQRALLAVVADGTYDRLLKKWGLQKGSLRFAPINAGKLFEVK
jgi:polar amino acid transport system substrate-binding protein